MRIVDAVNTSNGGWQGGGGDTPWISNIYSYIAPATVGEGNITQQKALQYAPHEIPTLYPIELPLLKNSTISTVKFNYTNYTDLNILKVGKIFVEMYISNVTGNNKLYLAESSNGEQWTNYQAIFNTNGISEISVVSSNNSIFAAMIINNTLQVVNIEPSTGNYHLIKTIGLDQGHIGGIFNGTADQLFIILCSGRIMGNMYHYSLISLNETTGSYSSMNIGNGTSSINGFFYHGN